jgi:hypothetical protein
VTAHFECADSRSGVASCPPDQEVNTDGANQTAIGTVVDNAGNIAAVTSDAFAIDLTGPTLTVSLSPAANV